MPRDRRPVDESGGGDELRRVEELLGDGSSSSPLSARPEASSLPEENLEHTRYDRRLWGELNEASEPLRSLPRDEEAPRTFPALLKDLFLSYFKTQPNLLPEEAVRPGHREANRPLVERVLEDPDTYRARAVTTGDVAASGLAALAAGERLLEEIKERPSLAGYMEKTAQPEPPVAPTAGDKPAGAAPDGEPEGGADGPEEGTGPGDVPVPGLPNRDARRAARAASKAGEEAAGSVGSALSGWGLAPADLARVPLGERLELLKTLSGPAMRRFVELLGRMRNLARKSAREKVRGRRDEIHSIELSGDLSRLLPAELAALASDEPLRRLEAEARLLEGRSASWRLEAREQRTKGPVVAMVDASGSMAGERIEWATAVALGLVDLAAGRGGLPKRAAVLLYFNARVVEEIRFAPGERDPRKLLAAATVNANGGTDYRPPLERALEICREAACSGADLLLVTDALCALPEEYLQSLLARKRERGTKLYSVLLGHDPAAELARYSEGVYTLADLAGAGNGVAGEVFGMLQDHPAQDHPYPA